MATPSKLLDKLLKAVDGFDIVIEQYVLFMQSGSWKSANNIKSVWKDIIQISLTVVTSLEEEVDNLTSEDLSKLATILIRLKAIKADTELFIANPYTERS